MARYRRTRRSKRSVRRSRRRPRRSFSRKRRAVRRSLTRGQRPIARLGYLLPKRIAMTTTYSAPVESMSTGLYWDEWIINASSIYDPDVTNVGHQCMLFDQMMVLYQRFFVKACRVKAVLFPGSSGVYSSTGNIYAWTTTVGTSVGAVAPEYLREQPKLYQGKWGYQIDGSVWKNVHNFGVNIKQVIPAWSRNNPDCVGTISSGPQGENCYVFVRITTADESSSMVGKWYVQMYYDVEFFTIDEYLNPS